MDIARSSLQLRLSLGAASLALMFPVAATAQMLGVGAPAQAPIERIVPAPVPEPPPPSAVPGNGGVPGFESVMASNSSKTAFTFDRNMLQMADGFFSGGDAETRRVVAGLNSISVRNYRAKEFARYDAGALATIDAQYRAAGWKHLVNANGKDSASITDLWLHFSGPNVTGLTVLNRGDRTMNVILVDCSLRPLDLLHLTGHFGIPKVDASAVMVPAP